MPRYVILTHDHPFPHWDLLLEWGDACRTWRLASEPWPGRVIDAEPLTDHRRHYLDYEGPVSGNRGTVARWDAGSFRTAVEREGCLRVNCFGGGRDLAGMVLQRSSSTAHWEFAAATSSPAGARASDFDDFVEHPRFGREPLWTGRTPLADGHTVFLHWINQYIRLPPTIAGGPPVGAEQWIAIPQTAVAADLSRQPMTTVPVTHYLDVRRHCGDCHRPFLFFALEQKFWYEDLQFNLASDAIRCPECRRLHRGRIDMGKRYAGLLHRQDRSAAESLVLVEAGLLLIDAGDFGTGVAERLRHVLRQLPAEAVNSPRARTLEARVDSILRLRPVS